MQLLSLVITEHGPLFMLKVTCSKSASYSLRFFALACDDEILIWRPSFGLFALTVDCDVLIG